MDNQEKTLCVKAENEHACVDFFVHENAMMHKDIDNERLHKTIRAICITFITIIIIFVTAYTVRTSIWLNTITKMNDYIVEMANGRATTGTEVADAVHQQSD